MNLLFSIDDHYTTQLATVLLSIKVNTKEQDFDIYVIQKEPLQQGPQLAAFCQKLGMTYHPVMVK
ncbi:MAG: glycosyltransferase family 8 protein, partial [Limosilactobacillus sp.]